MLRPAAMIVDSGGTAGVTEKAYQFYRAQRSTAPRRVFLNKGQGGLDRDRARYGEPEKILQRKQARRSDIRLVYSGTDKLKDEVTLALTRKEAGPTAFHLSDRLDDRVFAEFCAEIRTPKGWERRKAGLPNEALDLGVYGKALVIVLKGERIDWSRPPAWAAPMGDNSFATRIVSTDRPEDDPLPASTPRPARLRRRRGDGFVSRGKNGGL